MISIVNTEDKVYSGWGYLWKLSMCFVCQKFSQKSVNRFIDGKTIQ